MKGTTLTNKANLWTSNQLGTDEWNFRTKGKFVYIENISKKKVLGAKSHGEVILEDFEEGKAEQLWKKGERNAEGFFTLENFKVPKVMTAVSPDSLEVKGNNFEMHNYF